MTLSFRAFALVAAFVCGSNAAIAAVRVNGLSLNGANLNGVVLNGLPINGNKIDAVTALNGVRLDAPQPRPPVKPAAAR